MKDQKGFSLIEVVIAVALLGIIAAGFLGALGTASKVLFTVDERETAKNLAESQMEYVKEQDYALSYAPAVPDEYAGYSASIDVGTISSRDGNIQKIIVTIEHHGEQVMTLEGYKTNR